MKSYTTIEQSKRLLELGLDPNTADMSYQTYNDHQEDYSINLCPYRKYPEGAIPCWSLAALLELLPVSIEFRKDIPAPFFLNISKNVWNGILYNVSYFHEGITGEGFNVEFETKELVDAAYNMVIWLLKNKYLQPTNKKQL